MKRTMKLLFALTLSLLLALSMTACGSKPEPAAAPAPAAPAAEPAAPVAEPAAEPADAEYTPEQVAAAESFSAMTDRYNAVAEVVNADENLMAIPGLVDTMNQVADAITEADAVFADPANLTPEVIASVETAIAETNTFIDYIEAGVANYSGQEAITIPVEIMNDTGADFYGLAMSPANAENWGENMLSDVLADQASGVAEMTFTAETLVWDLLAVDGEGNSVSFMGLDFSVASTEGAQLLLTVEDGQYVAAFVE